MQLIVRLAAVGLIHGDFNEFNLMLSPSGHVTVIDFPQMISTDHTKAKMCAKCVRCRAQSVGRSLFCLPPSMVSLPPSPNRYFDRDVRCVREFIQRRFGFIADAAPTMDDVTRTELLDHEVGAYGFNQDTRDAFERELGDGLAHAGDAGETEGEAGQQDGEGEGEGEIADGDESKGEDEDEDGDESEGEDEERRAEREARAAALLVEEGMEDKAGADRAVSHDAVGGADASGGATSADAVSTELEAEGDHAGAGASDDDGDNDSQDPLENLRESNRAQLAFRDRAVAPASVQARRQKKGAAEADAPAAHLHRGHIDPNAVRQRVAAQINRNGKKGASKAKRNRNKDTGKIDRRAATKMTADW